MEPSDEDWRRVGRRADDRRVELGLKIDDVVAASGGNLSRQTWNLIRKGEGGSARRPGKWAALCHALRWSTDSVERILRGEEPNPVGNDQPELPRVNQLEARLDRLELTFYERLDRVEELIRGLTPSHGDERG